MSVELMSVEFNGFYIHPIYSHVVWL